MRPTIVYCHGCFDVPHVGHTNHLREAATYGDWLIVTVTADKFVNKGPGRPIFTEQERAEALRALRCVNYVGIVAAPTAADMIRKIRPDYYAKGPECRTNKTPGFLEEVAACEEVGCKVVYTTGEIHSSTEVARRIMETA